MVISIKTKKAGVVGFPIAHSVSPKLHQYWLDKYGIDGIYLPFEVKPADLKSVVYGMRDMGFSGCNVTIPHKENVIELCDEVLTNSGAVNTITFQDGKIIGENSDGLGFWNNLSDGDVFSKEYNNIVIFGAGGTTRGIIDYFNKILWYNDIEIRISNRNLDRAKNIADEYPNLNISVSDLVFASNFIQEADLIINTTSLGMTGNPDLIIDFTKVKKGAVICDIVYKPLMTQFLKDAEANGNKIVTGIGMLAYQATLGFQKWFSPTIQPEVGQELLNNMIKWTQ